MSHRATLLHHPAPGNPTHLSRRRVGWVALNIEQSPHFDMRRRPQACQPPHPSPGPPSPRLCFSDLHTNKKCSEPYWQLLFAFIRPNCSKGSISWMEKVGGNKKKGRGREKVPRTREEEKTQVGIMACTLEGLLTGALMPQPSFCKV